MFNRLDLAPADPILGLSSAFKNDSNPNKINLGVGVYQDSLGQTPILKSVSIAEKRILSRATTKSYLAIEGTPEYNSTIQKLLLGDENEIIAEGRAVSVQSPGGTGALRTAADFINRHFPDARIWLSQPTWANHSKIFQSAGLEIETYPYFDPSQNKISFEAMIESLNETKPGDIVLLHGCCHNPTGVDPSAEQWQEIGDLSYERGWIPLIDFAYQGFGDDLDQDAAGLRSLCRKGSELLIASSFSKNFGLYQDRIGALTIIAATSEAALNSLSQIKIGIRTSYSNPPAHGAAIVTEILNDSELRNIWNTEVDEMRNRISKMRKLFVNTLREKGASRNFSYIAQQRGMFSYSGLTNNQVKSLRNDHSIYIVEGGRINVAGMTESNIDTLCSAIISVL